MPNQYLTRVAILAALITCHLSLVTPLRASDVGIISPIVKDTAGKNQVVVRVKDATGADVTFGGGGGGGASTIADGADVAEGATTDASVAAGAAGSLSAKMRRATADISAGLTLTGSVTETAPATDTASSGLNGRLQRVAQRLTSLITALGNPFQAGGALGAGEAHLGEVGGKTVIVGGSFTRPSDTTAYASGDLVANSTTAGSVVPITVAAARINDGTGMIRRVRITTSSTSITTASFRVHFYKTSPTVTNGDNAAWLSTESTYLGSCDVTLDRAFSDGAKGIGVPNQGSEINFLSSSGTPNIFALIEARSAYTPTSAETITLACEVLQN